MAPAPVTLPKRVALTGASGMMGRHARAALEQAGVEVSATSRAAATGGDRWSQWNLEEWRTPEQLDALFPGAEAVVHAGAAVPRPGETLSARTLFDANVRSTLALGEWAQVRGIPMIYISGGTAYARAEGGHPAEDDELAWSGAVGGMYGYSKLLGESVLWPLRQNGLSVAMLRPSAIYGAHMAPGKLVPAWLAAAISGEAIKVGQPAEDRIDFIHAADMARAVVAVLARRAWSTFNVASGEPKSLVELAQACVAAAGRGSVAVSGNTPPRAPVIRFALDIARARRELGYEPAIGLEQGLKLALQGRCLPD